METYSSPIGTSERRRTSAAKAASIGIMGFFALAVPVGGGRGGDLSASIAPVEAPGLTPGRIPHLTSLPAGWPGPVPEVDDDDALEVWNEVYRECDRFGISDQALAMYRVIWEESRLRPRVVSPCARYEGISQFFRPTFRKNVREMKRIGIIPDDAQYSPFDQDQAIEVMAWMWSQGYSSHWGPYQRVARQLEQEAAARQLAN